jgi:hypothetical protein
MGYSIKTIYSQRLIHKFLASFLLIVFWCLFVHKASARETQIFLSPDGNLKALVITIWQDKKDHEEDLLEIRKSNDKLILSQSYSSQHHNCGEKIEYAAWTQDSQYFIYSLSGSSYKPRTFDSYFFDRNVCKIRSLIPLDMLDVIITNPVFEMLPPNTVRVVTRKNQESQEEKKDFTLSKFPKPEFVRKDEQNYLEYTARIYHNNEEDTGYFEILKNGKQVYKKSGGKFRIGLVYDDIYIEDISKFNNMQVAMGEDITGKGIPNLVVSEWTGGAHCCYHFYIFEIGKKFRKVSMLDGGHGDLTHFEDLDGDNSLEFCTNDWTFAYWKTSFNYSPAPPIVLGFRNGAYRLAKGLMQKTAPALSDIKAKLDSVHKEELWKAGDPPPALWDYMLELIYGGHADFAWRFFESAWPSDVPGKKEFLKEFRIQLSKSPYWKEIKEMNK